jgi:DnaJ family protein C protein 9
VLTCHEHEDKVSEDKKAEAHEKFQEIAFAYAVLSDPDRRKRYDATGSTSESITDADGFSWTEFYRTQFQDAVSDDAIEKFAQYYKNSEEEKDDILSAYEEFEGNMDKLYETVMLSNVLEDDERFRKIINDAVASGEVSVFSAFAKETKKSRQARVRAAQREGQEAEEYAKELGVHDKLFGKNKSKKDPEADLAALIQRNQQNRGQSLIDKLEEKYGAKSKRKTGVKRKMDGADDGDIPDEEFATIQANMKKAKQGKAKKSHSDKNRV